MSEQSQTQRVYEALRADIVTTRLAPGADIREGELAEQYEVSKTPIREALQRLSTEGLVRTIPRRGYVVRMLGLADVREIMGLRLLMEPGITASAAAEHRADVTASLAASLEIQRLGGTKDEILSAAHAFHRHIAQAHWNGRARAILLGLLDETSRMHYLVPQIEQHLRSEHELAAHTAVLEAVTRGDPDVASEAMRAHIIESNASILRSFAGQ